MRRWLEWAGMALRPSIQVLIDHLEQLRQERGRLVANREKLLREISELASRQTELKALLEHEWAKFKTRGWME